MKVILATFATEGEPYDRGLPLADCLEPFCTKVKESGIDEVVAFTPRTLAATLGTRTAEYCTRKLTPRGRIYLQNYHNVGMGTWRAVILKHVVDTHEDGDIVIYHDPNWKKYPGILSGFAPRARDYATAAIAATSRNKIFAPPHCWLSATVTRNVFCRIAGPDVKPPASAPCGRCRCIVLQITPETRKFAQRFVDECYIDENLVGGDEAETSTGGWNESDPQYYHNAGEQAVFNSIVYGTGLWDVNKDDWITTLSNAGNQDQDTGAEQLISWVSRCKGWKSDATRSQ